MQPCNRFRMKLTCCLPKTIWSKMTSLTHYCCDYDREKIKTKHKRAFKNTHSEHDCEKQTGEGSWRM